MPDSLPAINEKRNDDAGGEERQKFQAKNWAFFKKDVKKMPPQVKSRFLAYEDPPKAVSEAQQNSLKRLVDIKKRVRRENMPPSDMELDDRDKHEKLIGQLKAAEARNRIRIMRLRYETNMAQEITHLTSCQPTARKAVRMQALLPTRLEKRSQGDTLDKLSRNRVEALLEDSRGLLVGRT